MKKLVRLLVVLSLAGVAAFAMIGPASAGGGAKWNYENIGTYINGWSGGPFVDVYNGATGNDDFALVSCGGTCVHLEFDNGGKYQGYCIADSGNSPNNPRAVLISCSGSEPWGSAMTASYCSVNGNVGLQFKVAHWNAFLYPDGGTNGSPYYLNGSAACFVEENPSVVK